MRAYSLAASGELLLPADLQFCPAACCPPRAGLPLLLVSYRPLAHAPVGALGAVIKGGRVFSRRLRNTRSKEPNYSLRAPRPAPPARGGARRGAPSRTTASRRAAGAARTRTKRGGARRRPRSTRARTLMLLIRRRAGTLYRPKEGSRSATGGATGASGRTGRRPVVRGRSARPLEGDASRTATRPWAGSSGFWIGTPRRTPRRLLISSSSSRSGSRRCRRSRFV